MIVTEYIDDRIHHYSDAGYTIRQIETGAIYEDALDVIPCPYTYEETTELIEDEVDAEEALSILFGERHESV